MFDTSAESSSRLRNLINDNVDCAAATLTRCLGLCHDLKIIQNSMRRTYDGASPDEIVLATWVTEAAGVVYNGKRDDIISLDVAGNVEEFQLAAMLDFDSTRKCMSVLVCSIKSGEYTLFSKGADESLMQLLAPGEILASHLVLKHDCECLRIPNNENCGSCRGTCTAGTPDIDDGHS